MNVRHDITQEKTEALLKEGYGFKQVAEKLGCNYKTLLRYAGIWGIKEKYAYSVQKQYVGKRKDASVNFGVGKRVGTDRFKKLLWRDGYLDKRCFICGITEWLGQPAPLQLDHINGDRLDNRLENLRILCANCHHQQPTSNGKNKNRYSRVV